LSSIPAPEDYEQLIDYSSSPERMDLEDNWEDVTPQVFN
jgi:hypothetical protein